MNEFERAVRWRVMTSLRDSARAPSLATLADALASSESAVEDALRALAEAHLLVLRPGSTEVWMAHPFSAVESDHVVRIGERRWFANCAWDGLGILSLLGDGSFETTCPASGAPLKLDVSSGEVRGDGVIHFLVPAREFWDDIGFT